MEKFIFFVVFGGSWGALMSNPGERKFQGSKDLITEQTYV